jgi:hypothetical protein
MSLSERQIQIGSYLGIQPIIHGQIHTFQIAIPNAETIEILPERREILAQTLREHQSNLGSLVVRRTKAYDDKKEYEIVYGADWCIVAEELEIERLWVWVFDLTDEQAITMKTEMEKLFGGDSIQPITPEFQTLSQMISSENTQINNRLQQLKTTVNNLTANLDNLTQLVEQIIIIIPPPPPTPTPPPPPTKKLNLQNANPQEIRQKLENVGVKDLYIEAALNAIDHWKKVEGGLTWKNLKKSTKSGRDKIKNFGDSTYKMLAQIGEISNT